MGLCTWCMHRRKPLVLEISGLTVYIHFKIQYKPVVSKTISLCHYTNVNQHWSGFKRGINISLQKCTVDSSLLHSACIIDFANGKITCILFFTLFQLAYYPILHFDRELKTSVQSDAGVLYKGINFNIFKKVANMCSYYKIQKLKATLYSTRGGFGVVWNLHSVAQRLVVEHSTHTEQHASKKCSLIPDKCSFFLGMTRRKMIFNFETH